MTVFLTLAVAGAAQANAAQEVAPATKRAWTDWYGYQLLLVDGASIGLGLAIENGPVIVGGYLIAPVVIHAVHRRTDLAVLSPLARIFVPALGAAIGSQFRHCNAYGDECQMRGAIWGAGIGAAAALIADYSLAWKRPAEPSPAPPPPRGLALTGAGLTPKDGGLHVAIGGIF